ncbi:MAG TPA: Type 1 glutamine amidotransferase-like domain-containing protein [Acidothermaceae bacterium]|jgi:dipeptidase E|nr:Type 1 glutamine amidotransferase-like domain-containing protein [Acidothermaceae bacterium]
MKLYLASHDPDGLPSELADLVGTNRRVAVIANANDAIDATMRTAGVSREISELAAIGLVAEELDLRDYFDRRRDLEGELLRFGLLWAMGGNAFLLRRAMRDSRLDVVLPDLLKRPDLVYGGYSAGAVVAGPTLHGIDLVDDPRSAPPPYRASVVWTGLGLVPYCIAPHYRSRNYQASMIEDAVAYFVAHKMAHRTLSDGQTIVIDGRQEWLLDLRTNEQKLLGEQPPTYPVCQR